MQKRAVILPGTANVRVLPWGSTRLSDVGLDAPMLFYCYSSRRPIWVNLQSIKKLPNPYTILRGNLAPGNNSIDLSWDTMVLAQKDGGTETLLKNRPRQMLAHCIVRPSTVVSREFGAVSETTEYLYVAEWIGHADTYMVAEGLLVGGPIAHTTQFLADQAGAAAASNH